MFPLAFQLRGDSLLPKGPLLLVMQSTARERGTLYSGNKAQELARDLLEVVASCIQGGSWAWTQQGHHCQDPGCKQLVPDGHGYEFGLTIHRCWRLSQKRRNFSLDTGQKPQCTSKMWRSLLACFCQQWRWYSSVGGFRFNCFSSANWQPSLEAALGLF